MRWVTVVAAFCFLVSCSSGGPPPVPSFDAMLAAEQEIGNGQIVQRPNGYVKLVKIEENGFAWGAIVPVKEYGTLDEGNRLELPSGVVVSLLNQIQGCTVTEPPRLTTLNGPKVTSRFATMTCGAGTGS